MSSGTYTEPLNYATNFNVPLLIHVVVCSSGLKYKIMIRNDGKYEIYKLQHLWEGRTEWVGSIENEEFFTTSGDCWQKTGIHGTFDFDKARKVFGDVVSRLDKKREFRLVKVTISQSTEVM